MARILIHKRGPLLDLFQVVLAGHDVVDADGSQNAADSDVLIIDAESMGSDFEAAAASARQAVDADKPVLIFKPNDAHKAALQAAGALRTCPSGSSVALFIAPYHDHNGRLRFRLAEQYATNQFGGRVTRTQTTNSTRGTAEGPADSFVIPPGGLPTITEMSRFVERVQRVVGGGPFLVSDAASPASDATPSDPPPNVPSGLYDVTPIAVYHPQAPSGGTQLGYTPPTGSVTLEGLVTIGIYYDNTSFNQPVHWLLIEHSGLFYTAGMEANSSSAIGWSIGELQIVGSSISGPTIVTKQSSPNNVSGQTQYGSNTSFGVGLSAGTDGISASITYTIGSSVSASISDWQIIQSSPDTWLFAQAVPYNGATAPGQSPSGAAGASGVAGLPAISVGGLGFNAQTVWVQIPGSTANSSISFTYYTQSWFTYDQPGKVFSSYSWNFNASYPNAWSLNWSAAWPTS